MIPHRKPNVHFWIRIRRDTRSIIITMLLSRSVSRSLPCRARTPQTPRQIAVRVCAKLRSANEPHVQLGTAKLPSSVDADRISEYLYQWASTLTQSGANFPFALPLKADKEERGFKISLLKKTPAGNFDSAGEIQGTVEFVNGQGNVIMVRFFEGPAALADRKTPAPSNSQERLSLVLDSLVDVPTIMSTLPTAIRNGVAACQA